MEPLIVTALLALVVIVFAGGWYLLLEAVSKPKEYWNDPDTWRQK